MYFCLIFLYHTFMYTHNHISCICIFIDVLIILSLTVLLLLLSYSAVAETGEDLKIEWDQADLVLPIGLALTKFHCILLYRDK